MQLPQLIAQLRPESRGVLIYINSDEPQYLARIEEVLTGRTEQAAQPYLGDPYVPGMHFALIEQAEGLLFRWTGWRAATVYQLMDSVVPVLLFLALWAFFRLCGFSRRRSLVGVLLFTLPLLYSLNRPIHPRTSFLLALSTILLAILALERRRMLLALFSGILLGMLVGAYLWSWMFAWTYIVILTAWEIIAWVRLHPRPLFLQSRLAVLVVLLGAGAAAATPFVANILLLMRHPFYEEVSFRQGVFLSHRPESWIYFALFLCMSLGVIDAARRHSEFIKEKKYALLMPVTALIVINQQMIHGHILAFTSHFTFVDTLGAVSALLLCSLFFSRRLLVPLLCSILFLGGITYDNRPILQRLMHPHAEENQQFASLVPLLDALPRSRILSSPGASSFVSSFTQHDVLYSIYLESALMSSEEIARRYCVMLLPLAPRQRDLANAQVVWPDADAANRGTDVREREVAILQRECAIADADPAATLRQFGVRYVLWDEKTMPQWDLERLKVKLKRVAGENGQWSLFSVEGV